MTSFSHPLNLRDIFEDINRLFAGNELLDKLWALACLTSSPDPDALAEDARDSLRAHPFASQFGESHLDREGKTIHRVGAAGLSGGNWDAITGQIARAESIRRTILASGGIEPARRAIMSRHYVTDEVLRPLVRLSPAAPPELAGTISLGFARFFQGDFIGAAYILTPLLEAMLRHVMKSAGLDVTTFDDTTQVQEDRTISGLFEQMRGEMDGVFGRPLTMDIENVFLRKPGPHLRHALSHGLLTDATPFSNDMIYGCWLVFRLCMLPLVSYRDQLGLPTGWPELAASPVQHQAEA